MTSPFYLCLEVGEDRNPVPGVDLLQADDVGARLVEPLEQPRKPAVDAVDVVRRDLQCHLSDARGGSRVTGHSRSDPYRS